MVLGLLSFALLAGFSVRAQDTGKLDAKILDVFHARNIGPANMGGRIVDLAVVEKNPDTYYVAAATGGVWKTSDAGATWTPLMDALTCSIGAIAIAPSNPDIVWVGAGEANARNSVTWGDGVYKSTNGGKSWTHMGLKATEHIGRVVIHPSNPDIVYVAALGKLWGPSLARGLFKTTDGGKSWQHVLALDENTGCIDVAIDPTEPDILYAAAYAVRRDGFSAGNPANQYGPLAGLYKSTNGGVKWTRMTKGLPANEYGRCGLSIYRKDPKVVYAVVQTDKTPVTVVGQVPNKPLEIGDGGVFRSDDKGETWTHVNSVCPRPFYYGQIRVDPSDDQRLYVLGVAFYASSDGGKKFQVAAKGVHSDHHALWINPSDPRHLILGNDGGLYFSKSRAATWTANRGMPLAQFYGIAVDMSKPYRVYGGLQDNGSWGGPSWTRSAEGIVLSDWKKILGADGFNCQCDPSDANIVYAEAQYGKPSRIDVKTGKGKLIQPKAPDKSEVYRFNWSSPILLSPHNPKTLFYGGNLLFQSDNRGDTWTRISPDLTRGEPGKASPSTGHTLTTIAESPRKAGVIYVGADDGRVHITRDAGKTWTDLSDNVPGVAKVRWISRVECSHHDEATAYLTIDRHRNNNDHRPYVFKTTDYGATWTNINADLPADAPVHVIRESSKNPSVLFVGTEQAVFVTLDAGKAWHRLKAGLPVVPMHDLVIHPRERDLVIGTHGRGVYVMDIGPLEELTPKVLDKPAHLFSVRPAQAYVPTKPEAKSSSYVAANPPVGATIWYYFKERPKDANIRIIDKAGKEVFNGSVDGVGLQRVTWNLRPAGEKSDLVPPGIYGVQLWMGGETRGIQVLRVEAAE
jgi:photosystem II stability/assembly factor-like uncharacterized protein